MKDEKSSSRLRKTISAIKIIFSLTLVSMVVFLSACIKLPDLNYDMRDDIIKIDLEMQYKHPIEYSDSETVDIEINGRGYLRLSEYGDRYDDADFIILGTSLSDYYYLENKYWGCRGPVPVFAAFGISEDDISFVYTFKNALGEYSRCYVAEDYAFPESSKDEVSSIFVMSEDAIDEIYDDLGCLSRIERANAEFEITDREIIDEVVKNKNYDSLISRISDNRIYYVLAQFDGHIVYEKLTVLNSESESDTSDSTADNTEDSTMDNSVS